MILAVVTMMISAVLVAAALSSASGDFHLINNDLTQKKAYYAAQAGISDYAFHLNQDVNFWTYCTTVPVADRGQSGRLDHEPADRARARQTRRYAIELLPATGQSACSTAESDRHDDRAHGIGVRHVPDPLNRLRLSSGRIHGHGVHEPGPAVDRRHVPPPQLRRLHLLHDLRDARSERILLRRRTAPPPRRRATSTGATDASRPPAARNYCSQIFFASGDTINGPAPHRGSARDLRLAHVRTQLSGRDRGRRAVAGVLQPGQLRVFEQPDLQGHLHGRGEQHRAAADERSAQADLADPSYQLDRSDAHHAQRLEHDRHQRRHDDRPCRSRVTASCTSRAPRARPCTRRST